MIKTCDSVFMIDETNLIQLLEIVPGHHLQLQLLKLMDQGHSLVHLKTNLIVIVHS